MERFTLSRPNVHTTPPPTSPKLLSGLTADQTKLVLQSAEQRIFPENRVIIRAGERARALFLLTQGRVKYYRVTQKGEEVLLWWIVKDESFGIGTLLAAPVDYIGTAQTVENCELLVWSRDKIRSLGTTADVLAQNALHIVLHYLAAYTDRLVGLATETAPQRLAHTLLQLGRRIGNVQPAGVELVIMNDDLAGLANVSTFTASRQLKDWERQGIVQKSRGKVFIIAPE